MLFVNKPIDFSETTVPEDFMEFFLGNRSGIWRKFSKLTEVSTTAAPALRVWPNGTERRVE